MGIALGLSAAVLWGFADYSAAIASRRTGALRVVYGFHILATLGLAVLAVATGALRGVAFGDIPPFVGLGALGCLSYVAFYRSLAIGPISIVSPIVSGYAAVTVVLAVVILGERLSPGQIAAVTMVMVGVALASSDLAQLRRIERVAALGLALAILTMVAIGGFVFGVAYYAAELGWLAPIFLARGFTTVFLLPSVTRDRSLRAAAVAPALLALIALLAFLDTAGYVAFNLGVGRADTAVVATAAAPYAIVPIVLGVLLLRERPTPVKWVGTALVIGGVVLLGLTSQE